LGIIYVVTNLNNQKKYIGQTINCLEKRKNYHIWEANRGSNTPFHRAIRKYSDKLCWSVICECEDENLDSLEEYYIKKYDSKIPNGYNVLQGSPHKGFKHGKRSLETRKKLSLSHIGNKISNETKQKISEIRKVKPTKYKSVICVEENLIFKTIADANEFCSKKRSASGIRQCLDMDNRTAFGFHWKSI
jgi:hypothetical protein